MRRFHVCFLVLLLNIGPAAGRDSVSNPPLLRDDGRQAATLEAAGFDLERMRELDRDLEDGKFSDLHTIVVEYDGKPVYE